MNQNIIYCTNTVDKQWVLIFRSRRLERWKKYKPSNPNSRLGYKITLIIRINLGNLPQQITRVQCCFLCQFPWFVSIYSTPHALLENVSQSQPSARISDPTGFQRRRNIAQCNTLFIISTHVPLTVRYIRFVSFRSVLLSERLCHLQPLSNSVYPLLCSFSVSIYWRLKWSRNYTSSSSPTLPSSSSPLIEPLLTARSIHVQRYTSQ